MEWGEPTGARSRSDVLALRDSVLAGHTDMQLAANDQVCGAAARFRAFTKDLRAAQREAQAKAKLKQDMTGIILRDWQNQAVLDLDEYELPRKHSLTWQPCATGSSFVEFGHFTTHTYP